MPTVATETEGIVLSEMPRIQSPLNPGTRSETMRKVHAQSSAETSGLGDSLQRIHALSSTETSGYGGDANGLSVTTPSSPPEMIEDDPLPTSSSSRRYQDNPDGAIWVVNMTSPPTTTTTKTTTSTTNPRDSTCSRRSDREQSSLLAGKNQRTATDQRLGDCEVASNGNACSRALRGKQVRRAVEETRFNGSCMEDSEDSSYCSDVEPSPAYKHRQCQEANGILLGEASAGVSGCAEYSAEVHGTGKGSNKTQSAWLRWSHERRASFKRRIEFMEQRHSEMQRIRLSSPVRKARKESVRFVSPELTDQHLNGVNNNNDSSAQPSAAATAFAAAAFDGNVFGHPAFPFEIPPSSVAEAALAASQSARRKRNNEDEVEQKLTLGQWKALVAYWEHRMFKRSRIVGSILGFVALVMIATGFTTTQWIRYNDHDEFGPSQFGLWRICSLTLDNCTNTMDLDQWQIAVVGLVMFSMTFDFMALVLSTCGLCTLSLPKRIYYYHSAGEIHLLCSISCSLSLICYPLMSTDTEQQVALQRLGYSYFVMCAATACLCLASLCMCLDDIVRALANGFCNRRTNSHLANNSNFKV